MKPFTFGDHIRFPDAAIRILTTLALNPGSRTTEIAARYGWGTITTSCRLGTLYREGLVQRRRAPVDPKAGRIEYQYWLPWQNGEVVTGD